MRANSKPIRVLLSVSGPSVKTNPFVLLLNESVRPDVISSFFSWRKLLLLDFDVLHLHWPEEMLRGRTKVLSFAKCLIVIACAYLMKARKIPVLWTVHNPDPHEGLSSIQRLAYKVLIQAVVYRIYLSSTMRPVSSTAVDSVVVPHGHYKPTLSTPDAPHKTPKYDFIYFGRIKPYKGVPSLLDVFERDKALEYTVRISGQADQGQLKERIVGASVADHRVSANLGYLDEADLHSEIRDSRMVILPYMEMFNSGALLLALSLGRAVIAPRTPTTEELAEEVGSEWVFLYDGKLSSEILSRSMLRCPSPGTAPDLSKRDWDRIGESYRLAYERLLANR